MTEILNILSGLMTEHLWIAPLLSLMAGILTSFTPCSLSSVPVVVAYIGSSAGDDRGIALRLSLTMAFAMALTFGAFGTMASAIIPHCHHPETAKKGYIGAFTAGILSGYLPHTVPLRL
ncbi:hypothetical protein MCG98_15725 [Ruminococcus sp. OA3]|uniref:cytochrome c biogenesis protein CcdA n=1 Tax=Ruminococcus sp. OA3 TaxID=2914164 RepID=UPI001F0567D2|nr:cytochrome c biogenesis protein CcdA [Ruminococcus sp. OA3]MCH1984020.1 hypothetical protein [Ruminococcus sp. OA3]